MSLRESQALTGVHPWLAERIRFLGQVIDIWGGRQVYISGFRTKAEQKRLFDSTTTRPVASPGCSQHEYGYAVDVLWLPIFNFADNIQLSPRETNRAMQDLGRDLGLITVERDTGHFQVFPGSEFRDWAVRSGFCEPRVRFGRNLRLLFQQNRFFGQRTFVDAVAVLFGMVEPGFGPD